jgi:transglutaminase superfamily protein
MLRRRGIASRLHLGVTSPKVADAHAWVTVDEHPVVGGGGLERYVPLAAFR